MTTPTKTRKATTAKATAKPTAADERLAAHVARELFTDGGGNRAHRLVSQFSANDNLRLHECGGWGEKPMADYIARLLAAARHSTKGKGR